MKKMRSEKIYAVLAALCVLLSGCASAPAAQNKTVYAMDTVMTLTAYGADAPAALADAETELARLDALLDRFDETSALARFNRTGTADDAELAALTRTALEVCAASGGAFDPTVAPLADLWGFGGETQRVPSEEELREALTHIGGGRVSGDPPTLSDGAQIDLGGLAKGYAAERVRELFLAHGCVGTIDLGGDVCAVGRKTDGSAWRVAVKDPNAPSAFLGILSASDAFVVTSGSYERYFERDGVRYHHILDPATGYPADSGLLSATVRCGDGAWADALCTAVFVLGAEGARSLRAALSETLPFDFLLLTEDGRLLASAGFAADFSPQEGTGYRYEVLS